MLACIAAGPSPFPEVAPLHPRAITPVIQEFRAYEL